MWSELPPWAQELIPIAILLAVVTFAIRRLPKIDVGHSDDFRMRRMWNWLPLGFAYAFLYMGRYNLTVSKKVLAEFDLMSLGDFALIFGAGTVTYGFSFLINGPMTDRFGGKKAMLAGVGGAAVMNLLMGLVTLELTSGEPGAITNAVSAVGTPVHAVFAALADLFASGIAAISGNAVPPKADPSPLLPVFLVLYAGNMYFQSFGAVAIVKVNAPWFHVRERGVFGAIFGILISLGIYFAFDIGEKVRDNVGVEYVFLVPAVMLVAFWAICFFRIKNTPGEAGFDDFDTADASSGDDGPQLGAVKVFAMMLRNPVIMTIAAIEFCSGFLRQSIMNWYKLFAGEVGRGEEFVPQNWGMLLCCAGIMGGVFAGTISDHVFGSRRGPVAAVLYTGMLVGSVVMMFLLDSYLLGWLVLFMSLCIIGVHGMLSGTASMDFGGRKNVGIAVGIIDGFVYLGTGVMAFLYGWRLPQDPEIASIESNWHEWPKWMILVSLIGLLFATRVWNARPQPKKAS